jgi:hypothetical protein
MSEMSDKELVLSMIDNFQKIKGIDNLPTSQVLELIRKRLNATPEEMAFIQHAREILREV